MYLICRILIVVILKIKTTNDSFFLKNTNYSNSEKIHREQSSQAGSLLSENPLESHDFAV